MGKSDKFKSHLVRRIGWGDIDEAYVRHLIVAARAEDIEGAGLKSLPARAMDVTTFSIPTAAKMDAVLVARRDCVVSGMALAPMVLDVYSSFSDGKKCSCLPLVLDGEKISAGTVLAEIKGDAEVALQAERIMLNFLQRLFGVATETARYVSEMGGGSMLLDTRKTTPGLRVLEKYAFACGGGYNHRMGLFDRVMLKDNHLACSGATKGERLGLAVKMAKAKNPDLAVEVEVDSLDQIGPVVEAGADVVMLDNFGADQIKSAIDAIGGEAWVEVSGGVTFDNIRRIADIGPDFISSGAPIHSSKWIDIGLDEVE